LDKQQIDALVRDWLRGRLDEDRLQRTRTGFADDFGQRNDMTAGAAAAYLIGSDAEGELERWQKAIKAHDWTVARPYVSSLVTQLGLQIESDSPEYQFLCQALTLASAELHAIRTDRSLGDWSDGQTRSLLSLDSPVALSPATTLEKPPVGRPLKELIQRFLDERKRLGGTTAKRLLDFRAALALFEEWCGGTTQITVIDRRMLGDFRTVLTKLPPNHTKRFGKKPIAEVLALAESSGLQPLHPRTINSKYLALLDAFFGWCLTGGEITENPAAGVRVSLPKHHGTESGRNPFKITHLQTLFTTPLYTGCKSDSRIYEPGEVLVRDHRYWLPLIALWSGARLNELCQLRVADVREVDAVWCLDINADGTKRLKSKAAKRLVPIHPELVRLGFLTFVEKRRESGADQLWDGVLSGSTDYASDAVSKWFARFLSHAIGGAKKKSGKLAFHSFRHTVKDALRDAGVEDRTQDALLGHETEHVSSRYGVGYKPARLCEELSKIRYEGLELSHLYLRE
jgi:integrase